MAPTGHRAAPVNRGAGDSRATQQLWGRGAKTYAASAIRTGSRSEVSHGLEGSVRTSDRSPDGPVAPVPTGGAGYGNGGEGATGGGAGGFSGAAERCSQTAVYVPRATVALRAFARSLAPEPFLLLLERPG
jgi:hypothetical protein